MFENATMKPITSYNQYMVIIKGNICVKWGPFQISNMPVDFSAFRTVKNKFLFINYSI
jgi:hypothetical protein